MALEEAINSARTFQLTLAPHLQAQSFLSLFQYSSSRLALMFQGAS